MNKMSYIKGNLFEQSIEVVSPIKIQILNSVVMDTETSHNLDKNMKNLMKYSQFVECKCIRVIWLH